MTTYGTLNKGSEGTLMKISPVLSPEEGEMFFHPDCWEESNVFIRVKEEDVEDSPAELSIDLQ